MLDSAKWRVNDLKRYLFKKVFKLLGLMASLGLHLPSEDTHVPTIILMVS